jgi:hypothetical protein
MASLRYVFIERFLGIFITHHVVYLAGLTPLLRPDQLTTFFQRHSSRSPIFLSHSLYLDLRTPWCHGWHNSDMIRLTCDCFLKCWRLSKNELRFTTNIGQSYILFKSRFFSTTWPLSNYFSKSCSLCYSHDRPDPSILALSLNFECRTSMEVQSVFELGRRPLGARRRGVE